MKYLVTIILSFAFVQTFAQISNLQTLQGQIVKEDDIKNLADGSPYMIDEFTEGYLKYPEKTYEGIFMRYNSLHQEFEVQRENGEIIVLKTTNILRVGFDRKRPGVFGVEMVTIDNKWYQELLSDKFYKSYKTAIVEDAQPGYNTAERKKRFVTQEHYFIAGSNLNLTEINLKKKDILPMLKDQSKISKYVKTDKLKYSKEEDVIKILAFDNN